MIIGVPKETKTHEYRVAITPAGVHEFVRRGHTVLVEHGAGVGSAIADADYERAGARLVDARAAWEDSELLLKVKEPIAAEYRYLRDDQILFTYLHLAADAALTEALLTAGTTAIAYETVQTDTRLLPLLAPMSEIAGRLAVYAGVYHLQRSLGGRGVLAAGAPGVPPANVVVLGGGAAGENALRQAAAIGAKVTVLDLSVQKLRELDRIYGDRVATVASTAYAVEEAVLDADLVIGAALVPGAKAPILIDQDLARRLRPGTVLVDIAIDQGGCFADSRPTTHSDPTFTVGDSIFYCVANMPGAVPATSTRALTNVTLPYALTIAEKGWEQALAEDSALARGLNTHAGHITHPDVAASFPQLSSIGAVA